MIVTIPQGDDTTGEVLNALRFAARATQIKVQAKIVRYHFIMKHFSLHPINTPLTLQVKLFNCPLCCLLSLLCLYCPYYLYFVLPVLFILFILSVLFILFIFILSALSILIHTYPPCYLLCVLYAFDYFSFFCSFSQLFNFRDNAFICFCSVCYHKLTSIFVFCLFQIY